MHDIPKPTYRRIHSPNSQSIRLRLHYKTGGLLPVVQTCILGSDVAIAGKGAQGLGHSHPGAEGSSLLTWYLGLTWHSLMGAQGLGQQTSGSRGLLICKI